VEGNGGASLATSVVISYALPHMSEIAREEKEERATRKSRVFACPILGQLATYDGYYAGKKEEERGDNGVWGMQSCVFSLPFLGYHAYRACASHRAEKGKKEGGGGEKKRERSVWLSFIHRVRQDTATLGSPATLGSGEKRERRKAKANCLLTGT